MTRRRTIPRRRRSTALLAAVAAVSLAISACSGGASDDGSTADGSAGAADDTDDDHGHDDADDHEGATDRELFDEEDEPIGDDYHESLDALRAENPPPAEAAIDRVACELVSADDVEQLGYSVTAGPIVAEGTSGDECTFTVVNRYGSRAQVLVIVYSADDAESLGPDVLAGSEPVADVGVEAWTVDDLQLAQARLADGRVVSVQDVAAEAPHESLIRLLERAAARA